MKYTKRKYSKTHRRKKRRTNKKTKKTVFTNRKTRKYQRGSGKYKTADIYNLNQFIMNNCLDVLKLEAKPSEKGSISQLFSSKKNNPYIKCRRSMRVFNTEKMPPEDYLKYREIIKISKNDPYYANTERGNIEDIGENYIFDYVFQLHGKLMGGGTTALQELLKVINPCYLIKLLTLGEYERFIQHLGEKSGKKMAQGKLVTSLTTGLKKQVDIESICDWVRETNFNLFKLQTAEDLVNLFNSYYPINCPYSENLNEFERINLHASSLLTTNTRYNANKSWKSWDMSLDITFDNFYEDYFTKSKFDTIIVYSSLVGESFIRRLSTNIIDNNGQIVFKSSDGDGDFYEKDERDKVFDKNDFATKHFNEFIKKLNKVGGENKFGDDIGYEDINTIGDRPNRLVGTLEYDTVVRNQFIVNIIKFLAISMVPLIVNVTRILISRNTNYYGLFYHYYERKHDGDCYFLYNNIKQTNNFPISESERNAINEFINSNIPNNNYNKCVDNVRKDEPTILFPDCRIIDIQQNKLYTFSHTLITLSFHPFPVIGRYIQIMIFDNISSDDVKNIKVTSSSLILWNANLNSPTMTDVFNQETGNYISKEMPLSYVIEENVGSTFYNGFLHPILSPLREVIPVNSRDTTPRNTMAYDDNQLVGVSRDSTSSIGSVIELG